LTAKASGEGYTWQPMGTGGVLKINRSNGSRVLILE
jgi:hypothetical protein